MKKIVIFCIFSVLICLSSGDSNAGGAPPEPPVEPTTSEKPITTSTTPEPKTTHPTTTTTTPAPTTPPTTPTTTTTTTTTTPKPTTTTTAVPPTTSKPTPKPKPEVGEWDLKYPDTNKTCFMLKMSLELMVYYERLDKQPGNTSLILPKNASFTGSCNNDTQQIILYMDENNSDSVTFNFAKNDTLREYMLTSAEIKITPTEEHFPNMKSNATITGKHDKEEFQTHLHMSYKCKAERDFNLTTSKDVLLGKLMISDLQVEAFHSGTNQFNSANDCRSETPGIVPIAVGCSLAALIIIVLVAYLIGRRRSQARGYLSM